MSTNDQPAAGDRDSESMKGYLMDLLNGQPEKLHPDLLIDEQDRANSFIWVDVEGQTFWRVTVEGVNFAVPA